jgi:hypothetical protein
MGDYTRWTFNPAKDYAEVFKQQGRVDLDADWNEFVEIVNRRWRAETIDIMGRAVVPVTTPGTTPTAFFITPTSPGHFTIGVGRMYVDGLLAECHGVAPNAYDASLGEVNGTTPIPYDSQPYYASPIPLPSASGLTDLVYLDVWQREITALQDPAIREKALGGPDTTTRMQTVWQVKILPNVGAHACGDSIGAWDAVTALSAGRLTTSTIVPAANPDPCILSPTGGYRGLENRLYRVEVHTQGTVGGVSPAKFKWSRDNGSVVSGVDSISAPGGPNSVLTLKSLGRDRVLRFKADDWVEILDDNSELAGSAGFLTKIVLPPDETNRTITVNPPMPAGTFDPTKIQRHTRVRRWDQRFTGAGSEVDSLSGLITVTGGPLDIEDGIQVSFSADPIGGQLHVGDCWLFAARTADGSVDALQQAPPEGILHHFARLGFVTWTAKGGSFSDCRQFWPPAMDECTGCCTVTVGDGINSKGSFTDIQAAIDSLGIAGGEVCLGRGVFIVRNTIRIDASKKNVIVRGMGWATRIIFTPDGEAGDRALFDIQNTSHVILESFFAVARSARSLIRITDSKFCTIRKTALINLSISAASATGFFGVSLSSGIGTPTGRAIELAGSCQDFEIESNTLVAAKGIVSLDNAAEATSSITGVIVDPQNAVLSGVSLTLTDTKTGIARTIRSDAQGKFTFSLLPPGSYTISFRKSGALTSPQDVTVTAGATTNLNVILSTMNVDSSTAPIVLAASITASTTGGTSQSDVNGITIRANRVLALLSSIFLIKTEDCDIIGNQLFGLGPEAQKALSSFAGASRLNRDSIDAFQQLVLSLLTAASARIAFQAGTIVLESGVRVSIADNSITGVVGLLAFFLVEARIEDNQILALVGVLVLNGLAVRVSGNFIAGLLAGFMQAGLLLDFISEQNVWLGLAGLVFHPLTALQRIFKALFGTALQSGGFATSGESATVNTYSYINNRGASLGALSIVGIVKVHHDTFLTFQTGIEAVGIVSGDITITDNSFEVCQLAAVNWSSTLRSESIERLLPPLHVVERNAITVQGAGVQFQCGQGVFRGNTIRCPAIGFGVACQLGTIQDNTITGTSAQPGSQGLITISPWLQMDSSFRVADNRLQNGPGQGILIAGSLTDLTIQDNVIQGMKQSGITTSSNAVSLQTVRISGNDISNCQGGGANAVFGTGGAILLPDVQLTLLVHGNRLSGNDGIGMFLGGLTQGGLLVRLLVQDNSQDGNGKDPLVIAIGYALQFTGNQCIERIAGPLTRSLVSLIGQWIVATGNTVLHNQPSGVSSLALYPHSISSSSAIATSNILNGLPQNYGSFPHLVITPNISV